MKIKSFVAIAAVVSMMVIGCKKGDTGPAGKDGKDGTNGNASVTSATLNANSWTWDGTNYWRTASWSNVSLLTSDVVNGGAVMLYQFTGGVYVALPTTMNLTSTVQEHDFFGYALNTISVFIENSDLSDPNPPSQTYKLVCIPKSARMANPDLDLTDYTKVKEVLNLKD